MTERDDIVAKRYRELPAEEPPRALDDAILAASRRAVGTHPAPLVAPTGRQRWYVPLAAAAVIVLAVGLTLRVQLEQPEPQLAPESAPVAQASKDEAKPQEKVQEKYEEKKSAEKPAPERRLRQAAGRAEAPVPFPSDRAAREAPAASAPPAESRAAESMTMRAPAAGASTGRADDAARDRAAAGELASGATAKRVMEAEETPEKTLERIAELRKSGKHDEADKALAEFRKRFPEYKLSDEMKAKVERRP